MLLIPAAVSTIFNRRINVAQVAHQVGWRVRHVCAARERGQRIAQAEQPMWQNIGQIELDTPQKLSDLYNQAAGLIGQYQTQDASDLAALAARNLAAIQAQPVSAPTPAPTDPLAGVPSADQINQTVIAKGPATTRPVRK